MNTPQAGWYPDPSGDPTRIRWWDGMQWTQDVRPARPAYGPGVYAMTDSDRTLRLIAFVLMLISTVGVGWLIVPLAWMIPMTIHTWGIYKGTKANTVVFGVCALVFCSLIGGILLLVSNKDA
ncbi:DUF2510 domain-containing protein [Bifidobacterium catulorum]|uniref:DUF2510 domain-containing protein n=1 Tax=Bifidobacterium catulorum TaxID=1630173 RepID=UPI001F4E6F8B|nr:DUF2510 domain-containing protein [Bifidobacterium catulorum]